LRTDDGTVLDGPTVSHRDTKSRQRNVPVGPAGNANSWTDVSAIKDAVPGPTPGGGQGDDVVAPNGCYISELSDTLDLNISNESIFEFIEVHCPTVPPT